MRDVLIANTKSSNKHPTIKPKIIFFINLPIELEHINNKIWVIKWIGIYSGKSTLKAIIP